MKTRTRFTVIRTLLLMSVLTVAIYSGGARADVTDMNPGNLTAGGGIGFLGATPSGTAFALNGYLDYFFARYLSVGPLAQVSFTGNMSLFALSPQVKYWIDIPETGNRARVVLQGGFGFVHANRYESDASWIIPLGVGVDYALSPGIDLTGTFMLNFADLDTGHGKGAHTMPGLFFGVRF